VFCSETSTRFDAEDVTRTALSDGAEDWFDAIWYREPSTSGLGRIRLAAQWLREEIADTRIRHSVWRVHVRKIVATTFATSAPFGSAHQQTTVTIQD
jgi:hypothetical protein